MENGSSLLERRLKPALQIIRPFHLISVIRDSRIGAMFLHLTAHSYYSLQEGLASPDDLVEAAAAAGMPALGLTDHRLLTGTVEFAAACQRTGVQPVFGLELDWQGGPLALLATSLQGWANLCRLSSALALRDEPE